MTDRDYFGHEENVRAVAKSLPAVSLFLGPESVGKWELAEWARAHHGVLHSDVLRIKRLTQDNAKYLARHALVAPAGEYRLIIVRLDKATPVALNTLLKTLEETTSARFILIASEKPLATIVSRSVVFEFGLLSDEDVANILVHRRNFSRDVAENRARLAGGRVMPALTLKSDPDVKTLVLRALEAVQGRDARTLEAVALRWKEEHTDLLVQWCYETITGRWKHFQPGEACIEGKATPLKILTLINDDLRPRLVVRAALASVAAM